MTKAVAPDRWQFLTMVGLVCSADTGLEIKSAPRAAWLGQPGVSDKGTTQVPELLTSYCLAKTR